ncbi:MAG: FTR1 family protein [bacterium]
MKIKEKLLYSLIFAPIAIAILFLILPLQRKSALGLNVNHKTDADPSGIKPEKLIFLLQYIGIDYGGAVANRTVINSSEYQEMLEFSKTVGDWYRQLHPELAGDTTHWELKRLEKLVEAKGAWSEIKISTNRLIREISDELNVNPYPTGVPDLAEGKRYYELACAECHGVRGDGWGRSAKEINPPPSSFQDAEYMNEATPYQFFNAITFGVQGTAMPSHQQAFNELQRWDIAFYLMTLRDGFAPRAPESSVDLSVKELAITSNKDLIAQLKTTSKSQMYGDSVWSGVVDYLRQHPPQMSRAERLQLASRKLSASMASYADGKTGEALQLSLEAYFDGFEPLEPSLLQRDRFLVTHVENGFSKYRSALRSGEPVAQVKQRYQELYQTLSGLDSAIAPSEMGKGFAFIQSLTIIVREGVEAALLVALLVTYLVVSGHRNLRKYVGAGALFGVVLGLVTWVAAQRFVTITGFQNEVLEGMTSLLAAVVLFSVSFWLIHKIDIQKWKSYIHTRAERAVGTGSGFALATAAFLAVYREAFETVLFYEALWLKSSLVHQQIILGFVLGMIALSVLVILIFKFGVKIPLKPFFAVTGILLALLAFVFAGYGVRELQNIGLLRETSLPWQVDWNLLEIHSTLEGLALQFAILFSFLLAWFSIFIERPRVADKVVATS